MKKGLLILLVILLFTLIGPVYAWQTGGSASGGGSTGSGTNINAMTDAGKNFDSGSYLFQLVYKPKNGSYYQVGKCVVAFTGNYKPSRLSITAKAQETARNNGCSYMSSGYLVQLAKQIQSRGGLDNVPVISEEKYAKQLISEFSVNYNDLNLAGSTPGNINSYGYRILVQKLTCFGYGSSYSSINNWCTLLYPRKSWAVDHKGLSLFGGSFQDDLYTTQSDIGIQKASFTNWAGHSGKNGYSDIGQAFANLNRGEGYNIIGFSPNVFTPTFDYSIDAACVNCESDIADNKAYIIQDISNWEAIFASKNVDNSNIKTYYDKGKGVYCKEEYTVYFPNANNTISVEPGRYFTLNPSAKALQNVASSPAIPNFKPVKVVKKRQCRVNSEENSSNANTVLDSFRRESEYNFKGKTGTVKFKYTEAYDDSHYNMDDFETMDVYDEADNYKYSINNGTLNMEVTRYYTLPANYYQYIRKQDGLSMKVKPSEGDLGHYINVGIPNLPVSFNNTGENGSKAADIQFAYELPKDDPNSKLYKAYIEDNSYLKNDHSEGNIYKKGEKQYLENSACAKMFGMGTSAYNTCVNNRKNNSIGDKDKNANCIVNSKATNSITGYSCLVLLKDNTCRIENGKYYDFNGNEITKEEYDIICPNANSDNTCRIENGKYYDFDGNEITKEEYDIICPNANSDNTCRIEDGKYYDFDGNEITKEEYDRICPSYIPPVCPEDECPYGCCPSGECAPMPDGTCPGSGGIDVIYRTIDLVNPFPGQDAEQRHTGANWCSYNIKTHKIDCKYNNQTVKNYITRERGGTENGGKVYREDHILYEVTLDSSTIGKIRDYNDKNKYDDWDLNCLDNGRACISEFLREQVKTTGKCSSVSKTSFYTCDEDV